MKERAREKRVTKERVSEKKIINKKGKRKIIMTARASKNGNERKGKRKKL